MVRGATTTTAACGYAVISTAVISRGPGTGGTVATVGAIIVAFSGTVVTVAALGLLAALAGEFALARVTLAKVRIKPRNTIRTWVDSFINAMLID
jgi:hypothetical protein